MANLEVAVRLLWQSMFEFVRQDAVSAVLLGAIDVFLAAAGFTVLRVRLVLPLRKYTR